MELKLTIAKDNPYPRRGFFVAGGELDAWLAALSELGIDPSRIELYGLPGRTANVLWGCLVLAEAADLPADLGRYAAAHGPFPELIVPAWARVVPTLTPEDRTRLFAGARYVSHPEIGWFKLIEAIDLSAHLALDNVRPLAALKPVPFARIPAEPRGFRVAATPVEELEKNIVSGPPREKLPDEPLNLLEKARMRLYEQFMRTEKTDAGDRSDLKPVGEHLEALAARLGMHGENLKQRMLEDYDRLRERNKKAVDKLLDLMRKDPERALRYAIPLDEHGYQRGGRQAAFELRDRGGFSLFGNASGSGSGGGSVNLGGGEYLRLRNQYTQAALALREKGEYEKAAYVYLKLLNNYGEAAKTLRAGGLYEQAALVYLKYLKDELKAAECYAQGYVYDRAIELYEKHGKLETVGDLYRQAGDEASAVAAYQKVVEGHVHNGKYLKGALLCTQKMGDWEQAQELLLQGWRNKSDAFNCLNGYFANIADPEARLRAVRRVHAREVDETNEVVFLKTLKYEFKKNEEHRAEIRDLAYPLIARLLAREAITGQELLAFNPGDGRLLADTIRYRTGKNKRLDG